MRAFHRLLAFAFISSVACILLQRGAYFYTEHELQFTAVQNLMVALGMGVVYIIGALPSHRIAARFGERKTVIVILVVQMLCTLAMGLSASVWVLVSSMWLFNMISGTLWPIIESYVSAGRSSKSASSAIGAYNVSWSFALPVSVVASGFLIANVHSGMFFVSTLLTAMGFALACLMSSRPPYYADNHPDRPSDQQVAQMRTLLTSSRFTLVSSYCLMSVLAPTVPVIFKDHLRLSVEQATMLAAVFDVTRACTFLAMALTHRWHNRRDVLVLSALLLPVGFFFTLCGPNIWIVAPAEIVFGIGAGLAYYSALYYAMASNNASVESGGAHEALIGSGFALGPLAALAGGILGTAWSAPILGIAVGASPVVAVTLAGALWTLRASEKQSALRAAV